MLKVISNGFCRCIDDMCCEAQDEYLNRTCRFETVWPDAIRGGECCREKMEVQMACMGSSIVLEGGKSQLKLKPG